jgi:hypothetical protein
VRASPFAADLQGFTAAYRPDLQAVQLDWETLSESNLKTFEVQHSIDGELWAAIGDVSARGGSGVVTPYAFPHPHPAQGINFYRLRKIDADANYAFSEVRTVEIAQPGEAATIFPNPTAGRFEVRAAGRIGQLTITDMLGRHILEMPFEDQASIDLGGEAPGVYWVKISDQERRMSMQRIVLQ